MFVDLVAALKNPGVWLYSAWIQFYILYRRTAMGPIWVILTPTAFIALLSGLYAALSGSGFAEFVPHLTLGFILWTFMAEIVNQSATLYVRSKSTLLSGISNHCILHLRLISRAVLKILHHLVIILVVCLVFDVRITSQLALVVPGLALLVIHAWWVSVCFSILAARFRDVGEMTELVMRIGFLATPIIWMPQDGLRSSVVGNYLLFNPFYHVLEPIRSAVLGTSFPFESLYISAGIALLGLIVATFVYSGLRRKAVLWL